MTHEDYQGLLAPYALGALEPADELACLTHLDECQECQREVEAFKEVTDRLAEAAGEAAPPAALRNRLMDQVANTPQDAAQRTTPSAPEPERPVEIPSQRRSSIGMILAGALALAVAGLLGWNISLQGDLKESRDTLAASSVVDDLVMDHTTRTAALVSPDGSSHGSALVEGGRSVMVVKDLPTPKPGEEYVAWAKSTAGDLVAVAAFQVDTRGRATVPMTLPADNLQGVYLSVEPHGKSLPSIPTNSVAGGDLRET